MLYTTETIVAMLMQQLEVFLDNASERTAWIYVYNWSDGKGARELRGSLGVRDDGIDESIADIYVRKSYRSTRSYTEITCLDIATIEIAEDYQGKGVFRSFVTEAHQRHPYPMTYIQSVSNPIVEQWCLKYGWKSDPNRDPPSFFLTKEL